MEQREWRFIDKANWGIGPWQDEPDKVQWSDETSGYPCLIRRSAASGGLCGYVGIPVTHPDFGKDYEDFYLDVHGGCTYAGGCDGGDPETGICHVVAPGEDDVWWVGFDCGHLEDLMPNLAWRTGPFSWPVVYRGLGWVKAEVGRLAAQLKAREAR